MKIVILNTLKCSIYDNTCIKYKSQFIQVRNTLIRRSTRENPERRREEQDRNTANRRDARNNEERREQEQV